MKNKLLNIYGCKKSKNEDSVVITLIYGEDEKREYYSSVISLTKKDRKVKAKIDESKNLVYLAIPLLKETKKETKETKETKKEDTEFPF